MKVDIFVHLFHVYHSVSQSHSVLSWNKSLHGLGPIFYVEPHGCIYVLKNKALAYIFDVNTPYDSTTEL